MKKRIARIALLVLIVLVATSCDLVNVKSFPEGNLKYASEKNASKFSDFQKDGLKVYETYADSNVFSFIVDFSGVDGFSGTFYVADQSGNFKYTNIGTLGESVYLVYFPDYNINDNLVIVCKSEEQVVPIGEFFPGITAQEEVHYTSGSTFLYNDELYIVDEIVKTFGYCIVRFNREGADPEGMNFTVYDHLLKNQSPYFIDDYTMYLTHFMGIEDQLYFKLPDDPDVFTIAMKL